MKKNNKKGFTLLEVLLSIIIVGLVLVCVIVLNDASSSATKVSKTNSNITIALNNTFNEFVAAPEYSTENNNSGKKFFYYNSDFSARITDKTTLYYLQADYSRKQAGHSYVYDVKITIFTDDNNDNTAEQFELYGQKAFYRTFRKEIV